MSDKEKIPFVYAKFSERRLKCTNFLPCWCLCKGCAQGKGGCDKFHRKGYKTIRHWVDHQGKTWFDE